MLLKVGDYALIRLIAGKPALVKCTSAGPDGKKYKARLEQSKDSDDEAPPVEFKAREIIANLGHAPTAGSVYGIKVEPIRERMEHPFWGPIKIHHALEDDKRKILRKVLSDVAGRLKAHGKIALTTEIRTQVGAMAGFYKFRPKADTDLLCVKLDEDLSDLEYRFSHEYAHGLWFRSFSPRMKMAWVKMYHEAVQVSSYSDKDLAALLKDLETCGDLRTFLKDNPDEMPVLRAIFRHIKQTHSVDRQHIELALVVGAEISGYWPTSIELGEKQTLLTSYAEKSPEELWAEAFALKFIGKKLPSKISALCDKCLSNLIK